MEEGGIASFGLSSDFVHCDLQTASFATLVVRSFYAVGAGTARCVRAKALCKFSKWIDLRSRFHLRRGRRRRRPPTPRTAAEWPSIGGGGDAPLLRMQNRGGFGKTPPPPPEQRSADQAPSQSLLVLIHAYPCLIGLACGNQAQAATSLTVCA